LTGQFHLIGIIGKSANVLEMSDSTLVEACAEPMAANNGNSILFDKCFGEAQHESKGTAAAQHNPLPKTTSLN